MHIVYRILLVLHIASAAVLFGGAIGLTRSLRQHLEGPREAFLATAQEAFRRGKLMGIFALATLATGIALIFTVGGFGSVRISIHIALTLMLVAVGVSATIMTPHTAKVLKLAEAPQLDIADAQKSIKRLTIGQGILHLLWIVILFLMVWH